MKTFKGIFAFAALAGLAQALIVPQYCTCSDLKHKQECVQMMQTCIWDDATSTCSQRDCGESQLVCMNAIARTNCVFIGNKCQVRKATCAEYTSDTVIQFCSFPVGVSFATEGFCEVDSAAESKKCKKLTQPACKSFTTKDTCDTIGLNPFSNARRCYFDDSKKGGDENPKCLDTPLDCSGTIEAACEARGCSWDWRAEKCQVTTCSILSRAKCDTYVNRAGVLKFCKREGRSCVDQDNLSFTVEECRSRTAYFYHFDGYCKPCYDAPLLTNQVNSTDSHGLTLVNSCLVGMLAIIIMS